MILLALDQASRTSGYAVFDNQDLIDSGTFTLTSDNIVFKLLKYQPKYLELHRNI